MMSRRTTTGSGKGRRGELALLVVLGLASLSAAAQLVLESAAVTAGGGTVAGGSLEASVVAGDPSSGTSRGGPYVVVFGVQAQIEGDVLFRSGFEGG